MAGAKKPTPRKKKRPRSSSRPTSTLRIVRRSQAATTAEAARRLGVSESTLRRRARAGTIVASIDESGRYHFPGASSAGSRKKKRLATKKRPTAKTAPLRKQRRVPAPAAIAAPAAPAASAAIPRRKTAAGKKLARPAKKSNKVVRAKKKAKKTVSARPVKRPAVPKKPTPRGQLPAAGKKKKRRAKKSKRPARPPRRPVVKRRPPPPTVPSPFGGTIVDPTYREPEPSLEFPMPLEQAAQKIGHAMRDFVMSRFKWERVQTGEEFYALKVAFRWTYGVETWNDTFDWIVDEWGLAPYIFDRESLRDS